MPADTRDLRLWLLQSDQQRGRTQLARIDTSARSADETVAVAVSGLISYPRYPKSSGISQDMLVSFSKSAPFYWLAETDTPLLGLQIYPFDRLLSTVPSPSQLLATDPQTQDALPTPQLHIAIQTLLTLLTEAVRRRVTSIPSAAGADGPRAQAPAKVAVLFSGGIDCTTVALLADKTVPEGEPSTIILPKSGSSLTEGEGG